MDLALHLWITVGVLRLRLADRAHDEVGEGVISTAIAVLVMAAIGAGMWLAFDALFQDASSRTADNVNQIGS
jgi:hypothetical protein